MFLSRLRQYLHHRHQTVGYVLLIVTVARVERFGVILQPGKEAKIMQTVTIGHKLELAIAYLDQNGNPMLTQPKPDTAPAWANTTAATETLAIAPDGTSATATPVAAGTDSVTVSVTVGGQTFSASLAVEVDPAPQVLSSIAIVATVE